MAGFVTALTNETTGITSSTLWSDVTAAAPLIIIAVGFAFGYYIVRRNVKGISKGKVRM